MSEQVKAKRVLLAEASKVTQDIVKLVLGQRGHTVTITETGPETLQSLRDNSYDIALIDHHLPEKDGSTVAKEFLASRKGRLVPRFVAITNDSEAIAESESEQSLFDLVIKKPFRIDEILPIVESNQSKPQTYGANEPGSGHARYDQNAPMPLEEYGYNLLYFPRDFYANARNNVSQRIAEQGAPDAIVITEVPTGDQIELMGRIRGTHSSPFIDLTGRMRHRADISLSAEIPNRDTISALIAKFSETRQTLHSDFERTDTDEELILVRMYCNDAPLNPSYDASLRSAVSYNTIVNPLKILATAGRLKSKGLIAGTFFDRFNACPDCDSARVQVREVCTKCQDPNLTEEFFIHHYRCAWQAPMSDFKVGDDLICPKCKYELRHFGKDYDKPASVMICSRFGHHNSEPDVRFVCLDCQNEFDAEDAIQRDIESFEITERGLELMESGRIVLGDDNRRIDFSDLPEALIIEINKLVNADTSERVEFALASIGIRNLRQLRETTNDRNIQQSRDLALSLLNEAIPAKTKIERGEAYDYILAYGVNKKTLKQDIDNAMDGVMANMTTEISLATTVFDAGALGAVS